MIEDELESFCCESDTPNPVLLLPFARHIKDQACHVLMIWVEKTADQTILIPFTRIEMRKIGHVERNIFVIFEGQGQHGFIHFRRHLFECF